MQVPVACVQPLLPPKAKCISVRVGNRMTRPEQQRTAVKVLQRSPPPLDGHFAYNVSLNHLFGDDTKQTQTRL